MKGQGIENYGEASAKQANFENRKRRRAEPRRKNHRKRKEVKMLQEGDREKMKELAEHDEPTVLDPNGPITVELNGESWKTGTVQEIADFFNIDLSLFNTLTRDAFESTLQGLSIGGRIEVKLGKHEEVSE